MQIENSLAYASPLYARGAQNTQTAAHADASKPKTADAHDTSVAEKTRANAVTGTARNNLPEEVLNQLIAAQETGASETDDYDGLLSIAVRHYLENIANDPVYAAKRAEEVGTYISLVFAFKTPPQDGDAAAWSAMIADTESRMSGMEQVRRERTAYYESLKTQGLPPAEINAKLLEFNVNLPESHDDTLGWSESGRGRGMSYSDYNKAQLDYLQNLIDQTGAKPSASA